MYLILYAIVISVNDYFIKKIFLVILPKLSIIILCKTDKKGQKKETPLLESPNTCDYFSLYLFHKQFYYFQGSAQSRCPRLMSAGLHKRAAFCKCISFRYLLSYILNKLAHTTAYIPAKNDVTIKNHMNIVDSNRKIGGVSLP